MHTFSKFVYRSCNKAISVMGRSKGRRRRQGRGNKEQGRGDYDLSVRRNELFEKFYSGIGLVPEGEWDSFLKTLQEPLPVTFRITGYKSQSKELLKIVKGKYLNDLMKSEEEEEEGKPVIPKNLEWYPDELGWQINLSRKEVRQDARLERLKKFLVFETESGNISRQEAVSMIPPLLMDIKSHHKVLDMCAAPGSKTTQLIEYLHSGDPNAEPEGFVIANDVDNKRCYLMVHQIKRLQSPCCAIINHDATSLPKLRYGDGVRDFVEYDRVLCDVPCSGDGTMRKNFDIWDKWSMNQAINLHRQQTKILKRGLELLAVGGRLVYSTCSFNPLEDEAVISSMLDQCKGCVELVDVSTELPGLKYVPGLLSWKLFAGKASTGKWYETHESAKEDNITNMAATFFCPPLAEAQAQHLDRCVRVLPHQQDTGGFFIAVMTKVQQLPWLKPKLSETSATATQSQTENVQMTSGPPPDQSSSRCESDAAGVTESTDNMATEKSVTDNAESTVGTSGGVKRKAEEDHPNDRAFAGKHHKLMQGYKEDPFLFLKEDNPLFEPIKTFYGITEKLTAKQMMYRTETGKLRHLYYTSDALRNLVQRNSNRVKFVNLGVKVFGRNPSPLVPMCDFRLNQEGIGAIHRMISGRTLTFDKKDMVMLLGQENPYFERFTDDAREKFKKIIPGSAVFKYSPSSSEAEPACEIVVCGWKGKTSVRIFVSKQDRTHYLRLFGLELEELVKQQSEEKEKLKLAESVVSEAPEEDNNVGSDVENVPEEEDMSMEEEEKGEESSSDKEVP